MEGDIKIMTAEERERIQNDAFAALEGKAEDRKQVLTDKSRIEELHRSKEKDWDDPYAASRKLRRAFRADRKIREKNEAAKQSLKDRMSLGIDLLEETEEDIHRAKLISYGDFDGATAVERATSKPLFGAKSTPTRTIPKKSKNNNSPTSEARFTKDKLRHELESNTRAVLDPFLRVDKTISPAVNLIPSIKRKEGWREENAAPAAAAVAGLSSTKQKISLLPIPLVDYDSD